MIDLSNTPDPDDFSDLYGLSVDTDPKYAGEQQREALREIFRQGEDIHPELKQHLETAAKNAMRPIIERALPSLTDFALRAESDLRSDTDQGVYYEWFVTEIDIFFQADDYDQVADVVDAEPTGKAMIEAVQSAFERYAEAKGVSIHALILKHEISESGGS